LSDVGLLDTETVILHPRDGSTTDSSGSTIPAFGDDETLEEAIVWPNVSSETEIGGDVVTEGMSVLFLRRVVIGALDEMTARGVRYRVDADPSQYHNPAVGEEVTQVQLLRRT
jgi:hypothetical protein